MDTKAVIPKTIHYCWFGGNKKSELVEMCIASWRKCLPDFTVTEWNESNYDVTKHPFTQRMHKERKWAFVSDYARLEILDEYGGIYLDTDMELVRDISPLLSGTLLLGKEESDIISAGMLGATPHHPYIQACRKEYDTVQNTPPTIPRLITRVYNEMKDVLTDVIICEPVAFYPYSQEMIKGYRKENLTKETYGVHLWNYSWGHPLNRFFKKIGIHRIGTRIVEMLGVKKILKKILGFS